MTVLNGKAMVNTIRKTGRLLFKVVKAVEKPKKALAVIALKL